MMGTLAEAAVWQQMHDETLRTIVKQFKGVRIAVMGDPMLDYYHFGRVDRISPEAPVPVFVEEKIDLRDGGAANVVENLRGLGCDAVALFPPAPFTTKHRYMVGSHQVFRVDNDRDHSKQEPREDWTAAMEAKAFVISDYDKGWCTTKRCSGLIAAAKTMDVPVVVDPKGLFWGKYEGATIICPNQRELIQGYDEHSGHILHKRGKHGMTLIYPDRTEEHFPAQARQVFDVTGAGDTVAAVLAAALAVRAEYRIAVQLANIAAGVVVGQVGTTAITTATLLAALPQ